MNKPSDKQLITIEINPNELIKLSEDGKKFLVSKNAEVGLLKLLEMQEKLEEVLEQVKDILSVEMDKSHTVKIEGEKVEATKRAYGEKYEVFDRDIALASGMAKTMTTVRPDSSEIDKYIKINGQLPEGVKLRERMPKVSISLKREKKK